MTEHFFISTLLGLSIGSFLNVVIYRIPRGKSIIFKRSNCPSCRQKLKPNDLMPIISWIVLKGKCRYCQTKIGFRYPFVEALTAISFILCFFNGLGESNLILTYSKIFFGWILFSCLISISFIDIDHMIIPRQIIVFGIISGVLMNLINGYFTTNNLLIGLSEIFYAGLIGILGTSFLNILIEFVFKKPGIGGGDGKLFALSGIWLGLPGLEVTVLLSFIFAGLFSVTGLAIKKIKRGQYIAFGPFICLSIALNWLIGSKFLLIYLSDLFWWRIT
tara:strand:- start:1572 stop:2396 length:825 start_codon:yes stop_codon:yes gene_type:complete